MFRVIEIVDTNQIIINYGSCDGAQEGQTVRIYSIGRYVIDPETNDALGTWDIIKASLMITETFEKFSICSDKQIKSTSILNPFPSEFNRVTVQYFDINVDENQITNNKNNPPTPIGVGDFVEILEKG